MKCVDIFLTLVFGSIAPQTPFTRLRVAVRDMARVDDAQLKNTGANGVVRNRNEVQVIYGVKVGQVRSRVDNWLAEN